MGEESVARLMEAVDSYVPEPERAIDRPFLLAVEDVFTIQGRGTVATGRVEQGEIGLNTEVEVVGIRPTRKTVVTGVEMFNKSMDRAQAGDNIGALLRGVRRDDIERGQVIAKPGRSRPTSSRPRCSPSRRRGAATRRFSTTARSSTSAPGRDGGDPPGEGVEMVMPGDNTVMNVELISPIAMDEG